jgi:hypothetical protein
VIPQRKCTAVRRDQKRMLPVPIFSQILLDLDP